MRLLHHLSQTVAMVEVCLESLDGALVVDRLTLCSTLHLTAQCPSSDDHSYPNKLDITSLHLLHNQFLYSKFRRKATKVGLSCVLEQPEDLTKLLKSLKITLPSL